MTDRELLGFAAKACGLATYDYGDKLFSTIWDPLTYSADCAEMCAKLLIDTCFYLQLGRVTCDFTMALTISETESESSSKTTTTPA